VAETLEVSDAAFGKHRTSLRPQQVLGMVTGLIAVLLVVFATNRRRAGS
jgi:hypothetical protein